MALTRTNATLSGIGTSTPKALSDATTGIPQGCESVLLQADTNNIRFTMDGTAPTTTTGLRIIKDQPPLTITGNLSQLRFLAETGTADLNIVYQAEQ